MANTQVHWRDSALIPKFFFFDARVALAVVLWIIHWNWYTFGLILVLIFMSTILNYFHISLIVAWRIFIGFIGGRRKLILRQS